MAHFEIYILNYNGLRFLPRCLEALRAVELGPHTLSVNVVDNASGDGSAEVLADEYPEVRYIALDQNYGFSCGNNLGVLERIEALRQEGRRADFHVLLNNDTEVDSQWLLAAYEVFAQQPKAGVVGSKAIFADSFLPLEISCDNSYCPADYGIPDARKMGAVLQSGYTGVNVCTEAGRNKLKHVHPSRQGYCVLEPRAEVYIPIVDTQRDAWCALYFENHHPARIPLSLSIRVAQQSEPLQVTIGPSGITPVFINAGTEDYADLIQNAGSFVSADWYAGDRGFLTPVSRGFDEVERVAAVCGVSMFVRDEVWQALGGFDESFFAYYEDTDLSIRAQQLGWHCYYTPHSRLRHVHCGSGVEFSEYFLKNVAWSHLLFASKTMDRRQWRQKVRECKRCARSEFAQFNVDHSLTGKPNLYAYCRYLHTYPRFIINRMRAERAPVARVLSGLLDRPAVGELGADSEYA